MLYSDKRNHNPDHGIDPEQVLLEDILFDAYYTPGSSFLSTSNGYGPGNLFSLMATSIRLWIKHEGGDIQCVKRRFKGEGRNTPISCSNYKSLEQQRRKILKKYYQPGFPVNIKENQNDRNKT